MWSELGLFWSYCTNILLQKPRREFSDLANDRVDHNIIILTQDLDFFDMREKSSFATHQEKERHISWAGCQIIGGPFEKMNSYHTWKCLIKSGSYVLNYKRIIFSPFQIFDACVQAEKVLVYYLICYVEVDGLRNKTKYESSRSPEQWFTQFFGFTQKPTTANITTTGM